MRHSTHGSHTFRQRIFSRITDLSLFHKMFYGMILIVVIVVAVSSGILAVSTSQTFIRQSVRNAEVLVTNINTGFEDNLDQVNRIIMSMYGDNMGTDTRYSMEDILFSGPFRSALEENRAQSVARDFFQRLIFLRKDFNSIYIYVSPVKSFSYAVSGMNLMDYDPSGDGWYRQTVQAKGRTVIHPPHQAYQLKGGKPVISFSRLLENPGGGDDGQNAVVLMDLTVDAVDSIVDKASLAPDTAVVFTGQDGRVVYSRGVAGDTELTGSQLAAGKGTGDSGNYVASYHGVRYLVVFQTSAVTGWKLMTLTPYREMTRDYRKILLTVIVLTLVAVAVTVVISYVFTRYIFKPVRRLQRGFSSIRQGQLDVRIERFSNDELGQLVESFNDMTATIRTLIREKYEETIARQDAEFRYLQAQINPHFIYNTLQIISSMAVVMQVPEISRTAKNLARILRYSISGRTREITLRDELDNAVAYLEIQKLRFRDFLDYQLEAEEALTKAPVLKMLLQPLVENAVTHGIEAGDRPGRILIRAVSGADGIRISVWDNGRGIAEDKIRTLLLPTEEEPEDAAGGQRAHHRVGLWNIHHRMQLFYGPAYGLTIESCEGEWTQVTVRIPDGDAQRRQAHAESTDRG